MELSAELNGPVIVALAKAQEDLPVAASLSGGAIYELSGTGSGAPPSAMTPEHGFGRDSRRS